MAVPGIAIVAGLALLAAYACAVFWHVKKRNGLQAMKGFYLRRNLFLTLVALNGILMTVPAIALAIWASTNEGTDNNNTGQFFVFTLFGKPAPNALHAATACLSVEGFFTVVLAAVSLRSVAPWDREYFDKTGLKLERVLTIVLQVWWVLTFFAAWVARAVLVEMMNRYDQTLVPQEQRTEIGMSCICGFFSTFFLLGWCAWRTWCQKTRYEHFVCPACDGNGGDVCPVCHHQGKLYTHP